jgi:FtsP/CotA-like multicopper oxidase with cupredoxin domain
MNMQPAILLSSLLASIGIPLPHPSISHPRVHVAPSIPVMQTNDNTTAAGKIENGVLNIRLDAITGVWHPEGPNGKSVETAAFAEEGRAPTSPGPLIRVIVGTVVHVTVHNSLDKPLIVLGLGDNRGLRDTLKVGVGETKEVRFTPKEAGTYYYAGQTQPGPFFGRYHEDSQMNGGLIVDEAGARKKDRVFLISWWGVLDSLSPSGLGKFTMVINGLSWPHTERIDMTQGDSATWRWINLTGVDHPMHLHGFYYRVDAKGDGVADNYFAADQRRMAVTEIVSPGRTMQMSWSPTRPGNWIMHCHLAGHLSSSVSLDTESGMEHHEMERMHPSDRPHQMFGLVLGITVAPNGTIAKATGPERKIRVFLRSQPHQYGDKVGFAFVIAGSKEDRPGIKLPVPGSPLILQRDQPVAITVINQSGIDRASIHWHGIELESYPDGVPGWSGYGKHRIPSIAPGDSLTVHFTPPRAGSFMYHSHFNEATQIGSGAYAPIIVLNKGEKFDPETDRVLFIADGGPPGNVIVGPPPPVILNGKSLPDPIGLRAGTRYRFRVFNLKNDEVEQIALLDENDKPIMWRAIAKDGADLPASQATVQPASLVFGSGEIYDFVYTPEKPAELKIRYGQKPRIVNVAVHVR